MNEDRPSQKNWQNYEEGQKRAERYSEMVNAHFSFMDKAELATCGAALVACLNGLTSAVSSEIYGALIYSASGFFLAGSARVYVMELRNTQLGVLRDLEFSNAQLHLHLDLERHEREQKRLFADFEVATKKVVKVGKYARMAVVFAVIWAAFLLWNAAPNFG